MKTCKSPETHFPKVSRRSEPCSGGKRPFDVSKKNRNSRVGVRKGNVAQELHQLAATNFERPFTPRTWLRSARNFGNVRFGRFATFDFSSPIFFDPEKCWFRNSVFHCFRVIFPDPKNCRTKFCGVEKSKVANRLERALPKFRAD